MSKVGELAEWERSLDGPDPLALVLSEEWDLVVHERACRAYFRSEGKDASAPGPESGQEYISAANILHYVLRNVARGDVARYRVHLEGNPAKPNEVRLERVRDAR